MSRVVFMFNKGDSPLSPYVEGASIGSAYDLPIATRDGNGERRLARVADQDAAGPGHPALRCNDRDGEDLSVWNLP